MKGSGSSELFTKTWAQGYVCAEFQNKYSICLPIQDLPGYWKGAVGAGDVSRNAVGEANKPPNPVALSCSALLFSSIRSGSCSASRECVS